MKGIGKTIQKIQIQRDEAGDVLAEQIQMDVFQNELLQKCEQIYRREMIELGFDEFDVDLLIANGLQSLDKTLAVQQLADLNKDVKQRKKKDEARREIKRQQK